MTCAIKPIMRNPIPEYTGVLFQQAAVLHDLVAVLHNHWKQLLLCKENPHSAQLSLPVSARVWLRPQATETITCSARASINLGASRRLVSPWPSWPLSLRPKEAGRQAQCLITQPTQTTTVHVTYPSSTACPLWLWRDCEQHRGRTPRS